MRLTATLLVLLLLLCRVPRAWTEEEEEGEEADPPPVAIGERLFLETRFSQFFFAHRMALGEHRYVRMTEDVDVLLTSEGLARFRERFEGRGYTHPGGDPRAPAHDPRAAGLTVLHCASSTRRGLAAGSQSPRSITRAPSRMTKLCRP
jgi:hypothetical protein